MRNISAGESDDWATFVKRERGRSGLTQQQLANLAEVARETIWRWETGRQKPENIDTVLTVASILGAEMDAALRAAGLLADKSAPKRDARLDGLDPNDRVVRHIMGLDIDEETRGYMLDRRRQLLALRQEQDIAELELMLRRERGAA